MRKLFRQLHLWLSIPFGLIIALICFSGACLVFETELTQMAYSHQYRVEQKSEQPLPIEELLATVAKSLPDTVTVTGVNISSDPTRSYQVMLSQPRRASAFVNQYTGELLGNYQRHPFFNFMVRLHRWLLDSYKRDGSFNLGKTVVGVSTIFMVFILISGIVIWIPKSTRTLKNRLKIATDKGWRRFWFDLHIAGGIYTSIILLTLALTGLTWSFNWYRAGFYKVFGVEMVQHGAPHGASSQRDGSGSAQGGGRGIEGSKKGERGNNPYKIWNPVFENIKSQNPNFKQISIQRGTANVSFDRYGNQRASDQYKFDTKTGDIEEVIKYETLNKSNKIQGWIYSVHVGSWGGLFTKLLTMLASLLGTVLVFTGYYLWIKRTFKSKK